MMGFRFQKICVGVMLSLAASVLAGCGGDISTPLTYETSIAPLAGEDLSGPCSYELSLPSPKVVQRGVLVIFDRGDSNLLYLDSSVREMAANLDFAMLFARQCNAASYDNIQSDGSKGPGRALFAALPKLAVLSGHPEVANANVLMFGFSAAGVLSVTITNYKPERVIGVIGYAAASEYQAINDVVPSAETLAVPFLLLSSAADTAAGTTGDQKFFTSAWEAGAPWSWGVQNHVGHCCTLTTRPVMLPWIAATVGMRLTAAGTLAPVPGATGRLANFTCSPDGVEDSGSQENCSFTAANLLADGSGRKTAKAWLPDDATAQNWLAWVTN